MLVDMTSVINLSCTKTASSCRRQMNLISARVAQVEAWMMMNAVKPEADKAAEREELHKYCSVAFTHVQAE